jgi:hypothetical protein
MLPRRTLLWGGTLMLASAATSLIVAALAPLMTWELRGSSMLHAVAPTLLLAALIVLALGVGGDGVMRRSIVGKAALIGFGISHAYGAWISLLGLDLNEFLGYGLVLLPVVEPVLLAVAVIVLAVKGTLPGLWRFAPALIVAALFARFWHAVILHPDPLPALSLSASVTIAQLLLGGLALGLSVRGRRVTDRAHRPD